MESATLKLATPYTMVVSGQTGSGKTQFVAKLIREQSQLNDPPFEKIVYAYSIIQPVYLDLQEAIENFELVEGFPTDFYSQLVSSDEHKNTLLVLDDQMIDLENDKRLPTLFTMMRHKNISTILLLQNFYTRSRYMTTVTRNAQYLCIFPNPRDKSMINTLGRQIYPDMTKFLPDAFRQATEKPFGYLFIDLKPGSDERFRLREGIFKDELLFVYRPK